MLRLLPLVALALLPAAVAAPVPPGGRTEFGTNGVLTRADLKRVKFDSRPLKDGEKFEEPKVIEREQEVIKRADVGPERPKNRYDVAVHMPWTRLREGEPVPAYFVLRNNRGSLLPVDAQLSLFGSEPTTWNSCSITVRDTKTGKSLNVIGQTGWSCGRGGLLDIPADGFYCVKGDLGRTADGKALPPGEYEVDWRYGAFRSAPVAFTVLAADRKPAPTVKRPAYRFFRVFPEKEDMDHEPILWRACELGSVPTEDMAAALAVGDEVLVPDVHTIPAADKFVEAWVQWKPYRDGDRVVVTLRAVAPHKQVIFDVVPHLYLQIARPGDGLAQCVAAEGVKKLKDLRKSEFCTPLTIEVQLPTDWREHAGAADSARVAVLVTATELELPRGRELVKEVRPLRRRWIEADDAPVWAGIVRTDFTELQFPPRLPAPKKP
jgi:hypothetical protein